MNSGSLELIKKEPCEALISSIINSMDSIDGDGDDESDDEWTLRL